MQESKVFYRITQSSRLKLLLVHPTKKKDAMLISMKLHIKYLKSLEDSERVRKACLTYLQNWYSSFYPERPDIVAELQSMAAQLQGHLDEPRLLWKYAWMKPLFGWRAEKWAQNSLPLFKATCIRQYDKAIYRLEAGRSAGAS